MKDLYATLKDYEKGEDPKRPTRGTVRRIDGSYVDVLVRASSMVLRHVRCVGTPTAIGQEVTLSWENGTPTAHVVGGNASGGTVVVVASQGNGGSNADVAASTHNAAPKNELADADEFPIANSAGDWGLRNVTWFTMRSAMQTLMATLFAPIANAVTGGNSHNHTGGNGAQIAHGNLSDIGNKTHAQIDAHLNAAAPHPGHLTDAPSNGLQYARKDGVWEVVVATGEGGGSGSDAYFQDGSDGDITLDGAATFPFATKTGNSYLLTRDIYPFNLTVNADVALIGGGYRILCKGVIDNYGVIHNDGGDANGAMGGTPGKGNGSGGTTAGPFYGSNGPGGNGIGPGSMGPGAASADPYVQWTLCGGRGGRGAGAFSTATAYIGGGSGATLGYQYVPARSGSWRVAKQLIIAFHGLLPNITNSNVIMPGMPGGGGGKSAGGTNSMSGGGGGGGGAMLIAGKTIVNHAGARISCNGGKGADGTGTGANAGGGGGGGGGLLWVVYGTLINDGTISANGGLGGTSIGGGTNPLRAVARAVAGSLSNNSLSPSASGAHKNTLYLAAVHQTATANANLGTLSVTGWGLTWNQVASVDFATIATPLRRLTLFAAYGTPDIRENATNISVNLLSGSPATLFLAVDEIQNVTGNILQSAVFQSNSSAAPVVTLPNAISNPNNAVYAAFAAAGGTARVAGTGFVLIQNPGTAPITFTEMGYNDTTANATWTTAAACAGIAIELQSVDTMENGEPGNDGMCGLYKV